MVSGIQPYFQGGNIKSAKEKLRDFLLDKDYWVKKLNHNLTISDYI